MSTAQLSTIVTRDAHRDFNAALGQIDTAIAFHFRHHRWSRQRREDALAEARAATWAAWHSLLRRGKDPVAVGVAGIVANACRAVRNGRAVGSNRSVGRGAMDVYHWKASRATGLRVVSFNEAAWIVLCRHRDAGRRIDAFELWK